MRRAFFLVSILLAMSIPIAVAENEEGVEFTWSGSASSVELIGEWDWNSTSTMSESEGLWSTTIQLSPGFYCYKFIVDGEYIFDPMNSYRGYCDGIENSVVRVGETPHLDHQIVGEKLIVKI